MKPDKIEIRTTVSTTMNAQKKRNMMLITACCFLILSLCLIQNTLGKYASQTNGNVDMNVARWDILVNTQHIKSNAEISAKITPYYVDNPNVKKGVIAPGSIGYFDLTINKGDTDVSFEYELTCQSSVSSDVQVLKLYQYSMDGGTTIHNITDNKLVDQMLMSEATLTERTIRVYVKWDSTDNNAVQNTADTEVGHDAENKLAQVKVNLRFKQVV